MKKSTRILAVSLALCLGLGTAALAAGGTRTIEVLTGMKVLVNGEEFTPTDVNGNAVDVFAYNGTTYVPIRAMSEAFGLEVGYDAEQQAAVVSGSVGSGSSVAAPDTRDVVYILSHAPEDVTMEDGTVQTFYNEIYEELRWQVEDSDQFTAEIVSGTLPAGITYNEADRVFEGRFEAAETQDVVVRFTPRGGEAFERTYRFVINEPDEFNAAPVVIWGVEGDQVYNHIPTAYDGILYIGDDLTDDPDDPLSYGFGASPIGTQAGLDALAEYGLTIDYETRTDDGEWHWADNFVSGTLKGSTDGWVKLSVPVYAGAGANSDSGMVENGELQPGSWYLTGSGDEIRILSGNVDIYLNIIPLGD